WLALELARTLRAQGEEVRMVSMFDTDGPGCPHFSPYGKLTAWVREHGGFSVGRLKRLWRTDAGQRLTLRQVIWNARSVARWWWDTALRNHYERKYADHNPPPDFVMPANLTRI